MLRQFLLFSAGLGTLLLNPSYALQPKLKEFSQAWDPEDPYGEPWQSDLYDYINTIEAEETFFFTKDEEDNQRPDELKVIELTEQMYSEIFNSGKEPEKPWYVAFVRYKKT